MAKIINLTQGSQEWLDYKLGKFSASKAQAIASNGKGLETLCYELAGEVLTGQPNNSYTNDDIERGNELEEKARNLYELETDNLVTQVGFVELSERIGCSPDGFVDKDGLVEFKCPNNKNYVIFRATRDIDSGYMWQMQMQLYVTGRKWCDYAVYNENFEKSLTVVRVERDEEKIEKIKVGLESGVKKLNEILEKVNE